MKNPMRILTACCLILIPTLAHGEPPVANSETEATIVIPRAMGNSAPMTLTWSQAEERRRQIAQANLRLAEVFGSQPIGAPIDNPDTGR